MKRNNLWAELLSWQEELLLPPPNYQQIFSTAVGAVRQRQRQLGEWLIRDRDWSVDFDRESICFGEDSYAMQFVGSESEYSRTWLWGFANPSGFSESVVRDVRRFYESDLLALLPELKPFKIPLDERINGHALATLVAAFHPEAVGYYRCPYEGGAAYVLIKDIPVEEWPSPSAAVLAAALSETIVQMDLEHRHYVWGILRTFGRELCWRDNTLSARCSDAWLHARFDDLGRLRNCSTSGP